MIPSLTTDLSPLQQEAVRKTLYRREIRRSLTAWARHCGYEPAAHHKVILSHLEAVARREIRRLAICLPPGSAKSTYGSVLFPPWFLAQGDNLNILTASHNATLATKFGSRCRDLVDAHKEVLGFGLSVTTQAKDDWATTDGSIYFCAGVGSKIAGHRADLGLIDDPIGGIQDADSLQMRDNIWDWYEWNFLPRLKPNAPVVIITTRWHEDDILGRILERDKSRKSGPEWTVLTFPMEAEANDILGRKPGERLWSGYFTADQVEQAKSNPRLWNGAYQQRPSPEQGDYFRKEWLLGYEPQQLPQGLTIYCASDHACSTKDINKNDPSLLLPFGVDEGGNIWILPDLFWSVADTGVVVDAMLGLMRTRKPVAWVAETEHITKSIGPFLTQRMREEGIYTYMEELSSKRDKPTKARSIQGRMQMRKVYFPKWADWWAKAEHELLSFPVGTHDEFPDVLGVIGRFLDRMIVGTPPKAQEKDDTMTYGWLKRQHNRKELEIEALNYN